MREPDDSPLETEGNRTTSPLALLNVLWERRLIVALLAVLAVIGAEAYSLTVEESYTAEAQLRLRDPAFGNTIFGSDAFETGMDPARDTTTNVEIITSSEVSRRVARALPGPASAEDLSEIVEVRAGDNSDVVTIAATTTDPRFSAQVANAYATEYKAFQQEADRQAVRDAQQLVRRSLREASGAQRSGLQKSLQQLTVLEAVQTGNADVIGLAESPDEPSAPQPLRNGLLAGALGLILGAAVALLLDVLDRRLKTESDFEESFGHPVLASVPPGAVTSPAHRPSGPMLEPYRLLREGLRFLEVSGPKRTLLVTSPEAGEGKTTIAVNLGRALVDGGHRVIIIEADMRRPAATRQLGVTNSRAGLSAVLMGEGAMRLIGVERLQILPCGVPPPNPAELLRTKRMGQVLKSARELADIVIIDTPPLLPVADTRALLSQSEIDGVILVGKADSTRRDRAREAVRVIARTEQPVLGCVVTNSRDQATDYYYGGYSTEPGFSPVADSRNGARSGESGRRRRGRRSPAAEASDRSA